MVSTGDTTLSTADLAQRRPADLGPWGRRDTAFLRAVAILVVVNSHLDLYYPSPRFATGGAIGNALFFALSSFGLILSSRQRSLSFPQWCARRFLRLYPEIWMALFVYWLPLQYLMGSLAGMDTLALLGNLFYPPWWFVQILLVLYPVAYALAKAGQARTALWGLAGTGILYAICYCSFVDLSCWSVELLPFKILSCLLAFIFGAWLGFRDEAIRFRGLRDVAALLLILLAFFGHKAAMSMGLLFKLQFFQQFLLLPLVYYALKLSRSGFVQDRIMRSPVLTPVMNWLSRRTLGIYMVHTALVGPLLTLHLAFPINVAVFLVISFALAAVCGLLADRLKARLEAW